MHLVGFRDRGRHRLRPSAVFPLRIGTTIKPKQLRTALSSIKRTALADKDTLVFDGVLLAVCAVLFFANSYALIPVVAQTGATDCASSFIRFHANDFIGGCAFLAYTNLLFDLVRPRARIVSVFACALFIFACGLFWEYAAPLFVKGSVSDPLDLAAYTAGAVVYWALNKLRGHTTTSR